MKKWMLDQVKNFQERMDNIFKESIDDYPQLDARLEKYQSIKNALDYLDDWSNDTEIYEVIRYALYKGLVEAIGDHMIKKVAELEKVEDFEIYGILNDEYSMGTCKKKENESKTIYLYGFYNFWVYSINYSFDLEITLEELVNVKRLEKIITLIDNKILINFHNSYNGNEGELSE